MRPLPRTNPLPRWQRRTLGWTCAALLASGILWLASDLARAGDLPGPLVPWLARSHGLSALLGLFALGMVSAGHVGEGLRLGQRLPSGLGSLAFFVTCALSGYALAYLIPESLHTQTVWLHSALGLAAFALGLAHRRRRLEP